MTGRSTPYDTFTVAAHGGPSTAGDDDIGTLSSYVPPGAGLVGPPPATLEGDSIGRLTRVPSLGMRDPYGGGPGGDGGFDGPVLGWTFEVDNGNSYDVATFDVSYTRYFLP